MATDSSDRTREGGGRNRWGQMIAQEGMEIGTRGERRKRGSLCRGRGINKRTD